MKNLFLIIFIVFIQSCFEQPLNNKKEVISSEDMVKILMNRQLLISELNTFQHKGDFSKNNIDSLLSDCHISLGYSDEGFIASWDYYTSDASEELLLIYDKVLQELQLLQEQSKN